MAIEFHCPYCTASIRVPDTFAGKSGSCPKCATKLLVPTVGPAASQPVDHSAPDLPQQAAAAPVLGSDLPPIEDNRSATPVSVGDPGVLDVPILNTGSRPSVTRSLRKKHHRRKSQRIFAVAIPLVCFLLFFGVLGALFLVTEPELKGTLIGSVAGKIEIPSVTVSLATLGLTEEEKAQVRSAFENAPEAFVSTQMTCRVRLDTSGLVTDIRAGEGFSWFLVNPATNVNLSKWINIHRIAINKQRLQRLAQNGADLCRDKVAKAAGTPVVFDAQRFRDGFGLTAHVNAFGYVVEAMTEQRITPCVHEDANGTLYFALPENTTMFILRGRQIEGHPPLFSGEYSVSISTKANVPNMASEESAESDPANVEPDAANGESEEMTESNVGDAEKTEMMPEKMD
ncbi:MAG TPA: hypothetical protein EYG03_31245 [Planctomycetes bacterium]|nr:hypothetical protein [Fuerstiella sp.]HIK96441.1 hypothetical protein [Planctomycetota bacterium]